MIEYVGTKDVPVADLTPFPGNAKRGDVDSIRESLRSNGQYRSLVVRETEAGLVVLAGNHTLQALVAEGGATARCEIVRCDDLTGRRVNLADNRTAELGTTDDDALALLLAALAEEDSLAGTGYTLDDYEDLLPALVMAEQPSGARYAETDEELEVRREQVAAYQPRLPPEGDSGAFTELILVLTLADRAELVDLVKAVREKDPERTAGQIVLAALRAYSGEEQDGS